MYQHMKRKQLSFFQDSTGLVHVDSVHFLAVNPSLISAEHDGHARGDEYIRAQIASRS